MRKSIASLSILMLTIFLRTNISAQVMPQDFKITLPNASSRIEAGSMLTVKWLNYSYSSRDISRLNIYIVKENNIIYTIAENIFNNGEYTTRLPLGFIPDRYKVKIISVDKTSYAFSETFEIIPQIPIEIIEPNPNSIWKQGNKHKIKWTAAGKRVYINLLKLKENGKVISRLKIADTIDNKGKYLWHIPKNLENGKYIIAIRIPPIKEIKRSAPFVIEKSNNIK